MTDSKITHRNKRDNIKYIMSNIINLCVNLLKEEDFYDPLLVDDNSVHPLSAKFGMKMFAYLKEIIKEIDNSILINNDNTAVIAKRLVNDNNIEVINSNNVDYNPEIIKVEVIECKKEKKDTTNQQQNSNEKLSIKKIKQEDSSESLDVTNTCTNSSGVTMPTGEFSVAEPTKPVINKKRNCPPAIPISSFLNSSKRKSGIIQGHNDDKNERSKELIDLESNENSVSPMKKKTKTSDVPLVVPDEVSSTIIILESDESNETDNKLQDPNDSLTKSLDLSQKTRELNKSVGDTNSLGTKIKIESDYTLMPSKKTSCSLPTSPLNSAPDLLDLSPQRKISDRIEKSDKNVQAEPVDTENNFANRLLLSSTPVKNLDGDKKSPVFERKKHKSTPRARNFNVKSEYKKSSQILRALIVPPNVERTVKMVLQRKLFIDITKLPLKGTDLPDCLIDPDILNSINLVKEYFDESSWNHFQDLLAVKEQTYLFKCNVCKETALDRTILCEDCRYWYHMECVEIKDFDNLPIDWYCLMCRDKK